MSADAFIDSNVVIYLLGSDSLKADRAESLIHGGAVCSVQVLNELTLAGRRKFRLDWGGIDQFLVPVRGLCEIKPMTEDTYDLGRTLAERYQLPVYDAMIVASALLAGADTLYSEDMQDGLRVEGQLRICNPFRARSVQDAS